MSLSTRLGLTYLVSGQQNGEFSVNDTINVLDSLVNCAVISATTTAPPGSPVWGDAYIIPVSATGVWAGFVGAIAMWYGGWIFRFPPPGTMILVRDAGHYLFVNTSSAYTLSFVQPGNIGAGSVDEPSLNVALRAAMSTWIVTRTVTGNTGTPSRFKFQLTDRDGSNIAQAWPLRLCITDAAGNFYSPAVHATISLFAGGVLAETFTASKDLVWYSDSSGGLEINVTNATGGENMVVICGPPSKRVFASTHSTNSIVFSH